MFAICAGMQRSGSTWQYQVASHLVEGHLHGVRLGFVGLHWLPEVRREVIDNRWRVLKVHDSHPALTELIAERRAVGFYTYRDIRDVVYSIKARSGASFERVIGEVPNLLRHHRVWSAHERTLVQRYESHVLDPTGAIREIAAHLGLHPPAVEIENIAVLYSLEANRRRARQLADSGVPYDPHTQLYSNHLRSGEAGTWRRLATPAEIEILRRTCSAWLVAQGYETDDGWGLDRASRERLKDVSV